jgi:hypothetical protein
MEMRKAVRPSPFHLNLHSTGYAESKPHRLYFQYSVYCRESDLVVGQDCGEDGVGLPVFINSSQTLGLQ